MGRTMVYSDEMVYSAIVKFIEENRYSPSVRELCELVGKASTSTVHARLKSLHAKGYIKFNSGTRRTIQINDIRDVIRVVRCKDCVHWKDCRGTIFCTCWLGLHTATNPDDFCSYGERRNDEG